MTPVLEPKAVATAPVVRHMPPAQMVDEQQCLGCHSAQANDWQGSHHQLAMQGADPQTVLADFNNATFKGEGENTRFFRKGDEFWVNTPGPEGKAGDFKVAYTFGIAPLQQYLIEVGDGRLQALGVAWDTEKKPLVSPLSGPGGGLQESIALEQAQPERQFYVRGVPHHRLQAQF